MVLRWLVVLGLGVAAAAGCGGTVGTDFSPDAAAATGGSGGNVIFTGGSGGGGTGGSAGHPYDAGHDAKHDAAIDSGPDGFVEPPCPDAEPPPVTKECDPFATPTGCADSYGCYPFVQYPASKCDPEQYGTMCAPVGGGHQGTPCGGGDCADHLVCVITGQGNQCVQLCPLTGPDDCPPGLFCEPLDVEGFGGCF